MSPNPNAMNVSGRFSGAAAVAQYKAVIKTAGSADFYEAAATADIAIAGILQHAVLNNNYEQSETIVYFGPTKAIAGGVIDEGDPLCIDSSGRVVECKGTLTINPSGANNALDYTEKDAGRGRIKAIAYRNPGRASVTGFWELVGNTAVLVLSTDGAGAVTETGATAKTLLEADAVLNPLLSVANNGADSGAGTLTEMPAAPMVGNQNPIGHAREAASGAGSEIDIILGKVV